MCVKWKLDGCIYYLFEVVYILNDLKCNNFQYNVLTVDKQN